MTTPGDGVPLAPAAPNDTAPSRTTRTDVCTECAGPVLLGSADAWWPGGLPEVCARAPDGRWSWCAKAQSGDGRFRGLVTYWVG